MPASPEFAGNELASAERIRLRLGDRPVSDLRKLVEAQGVLCFHLDVPGREFSGLSWHHPEYGASILINAADNPGRRAFTTAHEYAHLLRRDGDSVCDLDADLGVERSANRFAINFLMPEVDVRDTFERRGLAPAEIDREELASLAKRYGTSLEAMGLRLEELDLVPTGTTQLLTPEAGPSKYFGRTRPRWRRRVGETFTSRVFEAYSSGRISVGKLARYLDLDIRKALELVEASAESNEGKSAKT